MLSRIMFDPLAEMRGVDDMFDRVFGQAFRNPSGQPMQSAILPVDILERDNRLIVRAAVPGISPDDLDISVDNNVLTIRGETRSESEDQDAKVYRREVSFGSFSRSIRLPEKLNLDEVDAEFKNGCVTISIPRLVEPQKEPRRINVRNSDGRAESGEAHQKSEKVLTGNSK
jgi:HSP20 family protein